MLELAVNHMFLANKELAKAMEIIAPNHNMMKRVADIQNQIRKLIADLENEESITISSDETGNSGLSNAASS